VILLQALVAPIVSWSILQVLLFAASCITIFVIPFTSSHKALSNIKSRALADIRTKIWERYKKAMESPSDAEARLALDQIRALQLLEARVIRRRTWPITGGMLIGFMFTFTASNLPFIKAILDTLTKYRPW